jgi:hypothetical protein
VRESGADHWYCRRAIGEQAFDEERRLRYIPQPSPHRIVVPWKASDPPIARQLFDMGPTYGLSSEKERESA